MESSERKLGHWGHAHEGDIKSQSFLSLPLPPGQGEVNLLCPKLYTITYCLTRGPKTTESRDQGIKSLKH
jgi:hypothetical protein